MSNTKFTKGPWQFHGNDGNISDATKAENSIAFIELAGWDSLNEGWHNAHLIAAAPEMYEMLSDISCEFECGCSHRACRRCETHTQINKLLAKARGE